MDNLLDTFEGKQRSVIAAYVLWFFLGRFGVHRFYLGYKRSALIMLAPFYFMFVFATHSRTEASRRISSHSQPCQTA
mgnify:CR=1 FL=1